MRQPKCIGMLLFLVGAALGLQDTAADPVPPRSQPSEAHADSTVTDPRNKSPDDARSQPQPVPMPNSSDTDAMAEVSHRFNELRSEWLDHREKTVDWWLTATSVFLGLLAIFAVVVGYLGFKRFGDIESEARENVALAKEHAEKAGDLVNQIQGQHDKARSFVSEITAETVHTDPDKAREATQRIQGSPRLSEIEQAIAAAVELQQRGLFEEAIETWHALAVILEKSDEDSAARAWLSVGYLSQEHRKDALDAAIDAYNNAARLKPDLAEAYNNRGVAKNKLGCHEEAILDLDEAIRLKPRYAIAYNNRGNAKDDLDLHEEAIADLDEAIRLKPDYAGAFSNRGFAKNNLGRHEEAIADHDEAIRLKPSFAEAYNNRGHGKDELGHHEEAIADYDKAIQLKPDYAEAFSNRGFAKNDLGRKEEAIADCQTAIDLARASGDEALASAAERQLKAMTGKQTP